MHHLPTCMVHQVSVVFPKNITVLEFCKVILVHKKLFLSSFYQLTDTTPKKNRPVCDSIYAEVLVQSKKYLVNLKRTLKKHLKIKTKR